MISRFKLQIIVQLTTPSATNTVEHCTAAGKWVLKEVRHYPDFSALNLTVIVSATAM
jgi:hypothetical protein